MAISQEPGGRTAAPFSLNIVQSFLNTVDLEDGPDLFATVAGLGQWLHDQHGAVSITVTEEDRLRVVAVREALRDILMAHAGHDVPDDASARLANALGNVSFTIQLDSSSTPVLVEQGRGLDAVLALLMRIVYTASIDGTWQRLKVCRNDACRWAFYDASKNHSSVWCNMATCGSQAKARAWRRRAKRKD